MAEDAAQETPQDAAPDPASMLAELEKLDAESTEEPDEEAPAEEPEEPKEAEEAETEEESSEEPEPPKEEPKEAEDDKTNQRLERIREEEKRAKQAIQEERQKLQQETEKLQADIDAAREFQRHKERARYAPADVLEALGVPPDDFELVAKELYRRSPAARKDPKFREQSDQELRFRELAEENRKMREEFQQLRKAQEEKEAQATQEKQVAQYLDNVAKAVGEKPSHVARLLKNDPEEARARFRRSAEELIRETDEVPEPSDVVKHLEGKLRSDLQKIGVDPDAVLSTKTQAPAAEKKQAAKTLTNDLTNSTSPRSEPQSREELEADVLRGLQRETFEDS